MRTLILETSGKVGRAALAERDEILLESHLDESRRRASDLAPSIQSLLKQLGWKGTDITEVIVGLGPGSYTGLRVGLASAKALAYAVQARFQGVETFAAYTCQAPAFCDRLSVVADGLQKQLFERTYGRSAEGWVPLHDLRLCSATDWLAELEPGSFISGPAAELYQAQFPPGVACLEPALRELKPNSLLQIARQSPWAVTTDMWTAEPLYLRGSSAEEKAARLQSSK